MSSAVPTAAAVLDSFLEFRRLEVSSRTLSRDRNVVYDLRESLAAYAPNFLAGEVASRFERGSTLGVDVAQLIDAYALVDGIPEFLEAWLPLRQQATARQLESAKVVLRQLVRWIDRRSLIDPFSCIYLLGYLDGGRPTARVPPNLAAFIRATGRPGGRGGRE